MGKSLNSGGIVVWPRPNQVAFTSLERKVIFITKSREKKTTFNDAFRCLITIIMLP